MANFENIQIFEENRRLFGYNLIVLDDWGTKLRKRFLTPEEKGLYIKKFGEKMIKESEFIKWYEDLVKKKAE
jgi:hypothetical protein